MNTDLKLSDGEQREVLSNPTALLILMDHHDLQQDQADSVGAECVGDELRREELRQHGAKLIDADPEIWSEDVRKQFAAPTGYASKRLARARELTAGVKEAPRG